MLLLFDIFYHQDEAAALVTRLLDQMMKSEKYGERRGAAFGLAGVVKGFGISCLKKYRIVTILQECLAERFGITIHLSVFLKECVFFIFIAVYDHPNMRKENILAF